jgi:hypothetical protein
MSESLNVDDLTFSIRRSERRKTIGITVERDGKLILKAPTNCPASTLESVAHSKSLWIYTKLAEKERLFQKNAPKQYVSGEGFYYLGRSYRLLLIKPEYEDVLALRLSRGRFLLRRDEKHRAEQHFINWYIQHGQLWLPNRISLFSTRVGVIPNIVVIRDLGFRWASCNPCGRINFNYRLMRLPPRIIEYLIVHELVHIHEPNHNQEFWNRVRFVMPDYLLRRRWLTENGARF